VLELQRLNRVSGALANDVELALQRVGHRDARSSADEDLTDHGLQLLRRLGEVGVVDWHVAPAEQQLALVLDRALDLVFAGEATRRIARQEDHADAILAQGRQRHAAPAHLLAQESVRHLDQQACAVRELRIPAHRAAVVQVLQDRQALVDDRVRFFALDVRDKTDAASVVLAGRVVEALPTRAMRGLKSQTHR